MRSLNKNIKICFSSSSGGHYEELIRLMPLIEKYNSFIITEKTSYSENSIKNIKTYYLKQVNRKEKMFIVKFFINFIKSLYVFIKERPDYMITTGALSVIPMAFLIKLFRKKLIYIESFAKITSPSLTGKTLYKYADRFYVQWEEMLMVYPNAVYKGGLY